MRALFALYTTLLRAIDTRARRFGFVALGALGVVVAWSVSRSMFVLDPVADAALLLDVFNLNFLAPVAALVFGTAALGDPTDDNTLVYLWLRPVARWRLAVAATAAAVTFVLPYSVIPAVIEASVIAEGPVVKAAAISSAVAGVTYSALFVLLGLVSRRSLVWGIGYLLIFESFIARGGRALGALSVHAHGASIVARISGVKLRLGYFSLPVALAACGAITFVALVVLIGRLRRADVP